MILLEPCGKGSRRELGRHGCSQVAPVQRELVIAQVVRCWNLGGCQLLEDRTREQPPNINVSVEEAVLLRWKDSEQDLDGIFTPVMLFYLHLAPLRFIKPSSCHRDWLGRHPTYLINSGQRTGESSRRRTMHFWGKKSVHVGSPYFVFYNTEHVYLLLLPPLKISLLLGSWPVFLALPMTQWCSLWLLAILDSMSSVTPAVKSKCGRFEIGQQAFFWFLVAVDNFWSSTNGILSTHDRFMQDIGVKQRIMELMAHPDQEVRYHSVNSSWSLIGGKV